MSAAIPIHDTAHPPICLPRIRRRGKPIATTIPRSSIDRLGFRRPERTRTNPERCARGTTRSRIEPDESSRTTRCNGVPRFTSPSTCAGRCDADWDSELGLGIIGNASRECQSWPLPWFARPRRPSRRDGSIARRRTDDWTNRVRTVESQLSVSRRVRAPRGNAVARPGVPRGRSGRLRSVLSPRPCGARPSRGVTPTDRAAERKGSRAPHQPSTRLDDRSSVGATTTTRDRRGGRPNRSETGALFPSCW